ncbi:hypothetical protein BpHYR1_006878 [Brachionus plicatilis]|uniref:Uncharacterized protein n=1 Tax=Brachionus plicatilis TaxID=10195 RepID=A0A3M7T0F0_BRAPC|nr:hypothetical protein BpHYR1_006878 [Brachionus plicatilis]
MILNRQSAIKNIISYKIKIYILLQRNLVVNVLENILNTNLFIKLRIRFLRFNFEVNCSMSNSERKTEIIPTDFSIANLSILSAFFFNSSGIKKISFCVSIIYP